MKIAFFVEGFTEQLLIKELSLYYHGSNNLTYSLYRLRGGSNVPLRISLVEKHEATNNNSELAFNIFDCGSVDNIKPMINHHRNSLHNNSFPRIIGLRDVIPLTRNDIANLLRDFPYKMAQKPIPTVFLISVMETEAWFIAESNHYLKISPTLTKEHILSELNINIETIDVETIDRPADTLNQIYSLAGESYDKSQNISRTISSLDLFSFYCLLPERISRLKYLITEIEKV
jgi:hypothetical protein